VRKPSLQGMSMTKRQRMKMAYISYVNNWFFFCLLAQEYDI